MARTAQPPQGRPTLLNEATAEMITNAIRLGMYLDDAAAVAGIHRNTLGNWLTWGREAEAKLENGDELTDRDRLYWDFLGAVEKARADAVLRNLNVIQRAAQDGSWQASAWFLERTNPRKWGRTETVEITGAEGGPIEIAHSVKESLAEKFAAAERAALARIEDAEIVEDDGPQELRAAK